MSVSAHPPPQRLRAATAGLLAGFAIFRQYPLLVPVGVITLLAQVAYSGINNVTLLSYVQHLGAREDNYGRIAGYVVATFLLAETLSRVPFGRLSDRIGRPVLLMAATALSVPTIFLSGVVPHFGWLFPLRWWDGMMAAAFWTALFALIGDQVAERHRANAMGVINMCYMVALLGGWAVAGGLYTLTGNPRLFFTVAALLIGAACVVAVLTFRRRSEPKTSGEEEHETEACTPPGTPLRHALLLVVMFFFNLAITIPSAYIFRYITGAVAEGNLGFNLARVAMLAGVPIVGLALLALPLSRLGDRLGKATAVRLAFALASLALAAFPLMRTLPGLVAVALLIAMAFSVGIPAWLALICSLSGSGQRGATFAGFGVAQGIAAILGPNIGGQLWDRVGHGTVFFGSAAAISLATLLVWLVLPPAGASSSTQRTDLV